MNQLVMERTARRTAADGRAQRTTAGVPTAARAGSSAVPGTPAGARTGSLPATRRSHEWRTLAVVAAGVLVVLLAATWSFAQGWGRGPVAGPGELAVDGGLVRVDGVVSAAAPQHAMPGMGTDEDPVAEGMRRISLDVTLMAGADPLEYAGEDFQLTVDGELAARLAHRDVLPGEVLPAGTQLSGTLLFDVPADATTATLAYDGAGSTDVVIPAEQKGAAGTVPEEPAGEPLSGAGHGTAGHGGDTATPQSSTEAGE